MGDSTMRMTNLGPICEHCSTPLEEEGIEKGGGVHLATHCRDKLVEQLRRLRGTHHYSLPFHCQFRVDGGGEHGVPAEWVIFMKEHVLWACEEHAHLSESSTPDGEGFLRCHLVGGEHRGGR